MLADMAKSAGIQGHEIAGVSYIGGSTIIMHWNLPDATNKRQGGPDRRESGRPDHVQHLPARRGNRKVRQARLRAQPEYPDHMQEFWLPNDTYDPTYPLKYGSNGFKVNHNAATMANLRKQHELYFTDMDNMIRAVNKDLGKDVMLAVPVGQAVLALREKVIAGQAPGIKDQAALFADDWGHATTPIHVLAAYCHFAVIYRKCPIGLSVPPELAAMGLPPDQLQALNLLLQQLAWDAVIHHPLSGVVASAASTSDLK